ncbi:MAG: HutP family protein [Clostridiaceae bacterium]|nr:HutP family protein [Clostridiaceae bacterium]
MSDNQPTGSKLAASAAIKIALTADRDEERQLINQDLALGIKAAAVDFGGEFISSVSKMVERAVVAAKREGLIGSTHAEEGAVAGAAREAISQIINKAIGLNVGGKIGIARLDDHIGVCVFFGIGLLHLNEVAIGLGHRVV